MKLVTTKFKSGGLHEKHVVATWNLGNHLSICFRHRETKKNLCRDGRSQDILLKKEALSYVGTIVAKQFPQRVKELKFNNIRLNKTVR